MHTNVTGMCLHSHTYEAETVAHFTTISQYRTKIYKQQTICKVLSNFYLRRYSFLRCATKLLMALSAEQLDAL